EQATGSARIDHRSDLFSLAVIVYQCLTGELPFVGTDIKQVFTAILHLSLPVPSDLATDLPPSFDAWWARAAARDVSQRFQTAKDFAEALNVSLRISEVLEVSSLMPRAEVGSTSRINIVHGSLNALGAQIAGGETLAIHHETLDESYSRTFDPEPVFRRRKKPMVLGGIGASVILAAALLLGRGKDANSTANANLAAASMAERTAPAWPEPPAQVPPVAAAPAAVAPAPPPPPARAEAKAATRVRTPPRAAPHRAAKPSKTGAAPRGTDDFGI
ncbi:MAG: hypothetical protein ABW133_16215, partial [Polyangiaceae bacterium]